MVFDDRPAGRIRKALAGRKEGIEEKKMFGGLTFLLEGRMFCGVLKDDLMVRVGPGQYEEALPGSTCARWILQAGRSGGSCSSAPAAAGPKGTSGNGCSSGWTMPRRSLAEAS